MPEDKSKSPDQDLSNLHYCPECRKPLRRINGKMGPFWGCSGFPRCRTLLYDVDGKPSHEPDEHYRCPVCTRPMLKIKRRDETSYWLCSGADRGCDVRLEDVDGRPAQAFRCRGCGHLLRRRHGKHGVFWGCSQYPECTHTYNDRQGVPDF